jgi:hypothetical protein
LKIIGLFKPITVIGKTADKKDIILGITIEGKKMTLCNCIESQSSFSNGVFSFIYWVQTILDGIHLENFSTG